MPKVIDLMKSPGIMDCAVIQISPGVWVSGNSIIKAVDKILIDSLTPERSKKKGRDGKE